MKPRKSLSVFLSGFAIFGVGLLGFILLMSISGKSPTAAYGVITEGLCSFYGQDDIATKVVPLFLCAMAVVIPLRCGLYNVGGEGQMYLGGLCATLPALYLQVKPSFFLVIISCISGMLGGAFWSSLAGLLKAYRGTNEVVSTLLLNYVAIQLISLVVSGPLKEENAPYPYSSMIQESAMIPKLFRDGNAHFALLLCPVVAIISWFLFSRTTFGVSLRIVGENQRVARYSGIDVKRTHLIAMTAAGALAGLAGSIEVLAMKHRLFHLFVGYYGYEGLVVAFISMGFPLAVIFSAYFIALLKVSGNLLQRELEIPSSIVLVFEGCAVLLVASVIALSVRSNAMTAGDRDNTS